ncbi:MAG: type II toxin-antitoxin system Phd/YefM family antitoxin [Terriglobales bacterium]
METTITATEANRKFSAILREVSKGKTYAITNHGELVAELIPPRQNGKVSQAEKDRRRRAWEKLMKRLKSQPALNHPHVSRDEMHER